MHFFLSWIVFFVLCLFILHLFFSMLIIFFHSFLHTNAMNVANFDTVHRSGGSEYYYFFNLFPSIVQTG